MARKRKGGSLIGLMKDLSLIISYIIQAVGTLFAFIISGITFLFRGFSSTDCKDLPATSSTPKKHTSTAKPGDKDKSPSTDSENSSVHSPKTSLGDDNMKGPIQKNQLPNGRYVIGKDIPVGTYDFEALHGSGIIVKYKSEECKEHNYYIFISLKESDKYLINVDCREGEVLEIPNNTVVGISRSNKVVLDL